MTKHLISANEFSQRKLNELIFELSSIKKNNFSKTLLNNICVYACGSLGRFELSKKSDLDLFFIYNKTNPCTNLNKYNFFSKVYTINKKLEFEDPSKNGFYWDFISRKDLKDIGSSTDDYRNSFTARLLLILESKPVFNLNLYNDIVKDVVGSYFIDYPDHPNDFFPMYLINDILRYWYTLTLNYEHRRDAKEQPHKKYWKRLKLKFPRLLTCFSTLACLYSRKNINPEYVINLISKTPLERLDYVAENNKNLSSMVLKIKTEYDWFLSLMQKQPSWWDENDNKELAFNKADKFHDIVIHKFIKAILGGNIELRDKLEL